MPDTVILPGSDPGSVFFTSTDTIYRVLASGFLSVTVGEITGAYAHGSLSHPASIRITRGTAHDTVLDEYSVMETSLGSTLTNTTLLSHGSLVANNTNITGLTIQGGTADLRRSNVIDLKSDGGKSMFWETSIDGITLVNGSIQYVLYRSQVRNTVISSGSLQDVSDGASAEWTTINDGARQRVAGGPGVQGAEARYTVIEAGGTQEVIAGASAVHTTIEAGGYQGVGGQDRGQRSQATDTTLSGYQQVVAGGKADTTLILSGGSQYVGTGGLADNTIVNAGGLQYVGVGGTASNTQINGDGFAFVQGTATATTINDGGTQQVTGTANGTTIAGRGSQNVLLGGRATATTVNAGGYLAVTNGSIDDTTLAGYVQVQTGGLATDTVIMAGGSAYVGSGGSTSDTVINAGGLEYVGVGGSTTGTTISGGFQFVAGTATDTTVNGGAMDVGAGGLARDIQLSGGSAHVYALGTMNGVDFAGQSATLYLDTPSGLTGTISNFELGDTIDFLNTSFASYHLGSSTLTLVTSVGSSYTYQFAGVQAGTELNLVSDGHGGTSLSLLAQFSASLVPQAGQDSTINTADMTASEPALIHAQT